MGYLDIIRQVEAARKQQEDGQSRPLTLGSLITWQGADGRPRGPARVDLIHTDSDGTVWAFVTLSDAWAAVNTKYVVSLEASAGIDTL